MGEDDDILGEIPPEVSDLSLQFVGLPQVEIVRIFTMNFSRSTSIGSDTNKDLCTKYFRMRSKLEDRMLK